VNAEEKGKGPEKQEAVRVVEFALASGIGFLVAEAVLYLGVVAFYHTTKVPGLDFSPSLIALDALSLGVGVTVAFLINEGVTVRGEGELQRGGRLGWVARWAKYQLSSLLGNVVIVVVQLVLLATVSLSPVYGSVVGAIVSYPVAYVVSMRLVWKVWT
jgi:putative flippase GtrA